MVHGYGKVLAKAVESGKVSESQLDESVRRVLRDKFALGLFDDPYVAEDPIKLESLATEGKDLSQRLAAESVTLLKNDKGLRTRTAFWLRRRCCRWFLRRWPSKSSMCSTERICISAP